ncbi:MAG: type VI secretion system contractile sheath small subunit [Azoarcus sp.]|jgi:type VI secretion system protein ImpB|nr:type VI secretion system contractile sheath small subunit [Azoarcus sp.]
MANESTQKKLGRVRPPRVQITYDVEIGDAIQKKELPFVQGVVGNFSGHNKEQPRPKDRRFVGIDRDNLDDVMKGMAPKLVMRVPNKLDEASNSLLSVELKFNRLEDFEPANVARQVNSIKELLDARSRLSDLKNTMIGNDRFEEMLTELAHDPEKMRRFDEEQIPNKTNGSKE